MGDDVTQNERETWEKARGRVETRLDNLDRAIDSFDSSLKGCLDRLASSDLSITNLFHDHQRYLDGVAEKIGTRSDSSIRELKTELIDRIGETEDRLANRLNVTEKRIGVVEQAQSVLEKALNVLDKQVAILGLSVSPRAALITAIIALLGAVGVTLWKIIGD